MLSNIEKDNNTNNNQNVKDKENINKILITFEITINDFKTKIQNLEENLKNNTNKQNNTNNNNEDIINFNNKLNYFEKTANDCNTKTKN